MKGLTRRELVKAGGAAALVGTLSIALWRQPWAGPVELPPGEALALLAERLEGIARIGVQARAELAIETDETLVEALLERLFPDGAPTTVLQEPLIDRIDEAIRNDFAQGEVVRVASWDLSRTEALLFALGAARRGFDGLEEGPGKSLLETAEERGFLYVRDWGPQETPFGIPFNQQSDGHAGIWFKAADAPSGLIVYFGGVRVPTAVSGDVFSIGVYDPFLTEVIRTPGRYEIVAVAPARNLRQSVGEFVVHEPSTDFATLEDGSTSTAFCHVRSWGPRWAALGTPFNVQPDGRSAFWLRTECAPPGVRLRLGDHEVAANVFPDLVTASLDPGPLLDQPGAIPLRLFDPSSDEELLVGHFEVR